MQQLAFFDCNCMIGKRADRREGEPWSRQELLADMNTCGISDAVVVHALSRDYDPLVGNQTIARMITDTPALHGCWAILPPSSGETPAPEKFLSEMLENNIVAAIAYPLAHTYSLSGWSIGSLLSALEDCRTPLLLPFGQFTWEELERLCGEHVNLPVIITGLNYRQLRFLFPLWEKYRNLFVDLSWLSIHNGLAYLSERGVVRQVLFGSNYPFYEPGAAVTMVTYADLNDDERRMVAGDTFREILRGIRRNQ